MAIIMNMRLLWKKENLSKTGKIFSVTNAFELMTDNKNRNAKVQCALFKGTTRDIFIDQKEFTGPIYEQVDDAYHFILRHINMGAEINGVYRSEEYELPTKAIREMVANAVVHSLWKAFHKLCYAKSFVM